MPLSGNHRKRQDLVDAGFLGRKAGRGFYRYGPEVARPAPCTLPQGPRPARVVAGGRLGPLERLVPAIESAGITVRRGEPDDARLLVDGRVALALTDGRTATERMASDGGPPLVLVDLALDHATAARVAVAAADQAAPGDLVTAAGLFQVLGKSFSVLDDLPGMLVMRTVCMLANDAADAVNQGVASAEAVDTAMRLGVGYPRGPLAWAEALGVPVVAEVLANLAAATARSATAPRRSCDAGGSAEGG